MIFRLKKREKTIDIWLVHFKKIKTENKEIEFKEIKPINYIGSSLKHVTYSYLAEFPLKISIINNLSFFTGSSQQLIPSFLHIFLSTFKSITRTQDDKTLIEQIHHRNK